MPTCACRLTTTNQPAVIAIKHDIVASTSLYTIRDMTQRLATLITCSLLLYVCRSNSFSPPVSPLIGEKHTRMIDQPNQLLFGRIGKNRAVRVSCLANQIVAGSALDSIVRSVTSLVDIYTAQLNMNPYPTKVTIDFIQILFLF